MPKNHMQIYIIKHVVALHINYAYCPNKGNRKNITSTEYKVFTVCLYNLAMRNRKSSSYRSYS